MRASVAVGLALVLLTSRPAAAQPTPPAPEPNAADLFASGAKHIKAKRFAEAADDLRRAFELAPTKQILWALALAERSGGRCDRALPLYERFIRDYPDGEKSVNAARGFASECRKALAARYQELLDRAAGERAAGDHATAVATYIEAEAASPDGGAVAVLERARTHVAAEDCAAAVPVYESFVAANPENPSVASARAELATCRAELAPPVIEDNAQPPMRVDPEPPISADDNGRDWYRSRLGWTLTTTGAVAVATGIGLVVSGRGGASDPGGANYGEHENNWNGARTRYIAGLAAGTVGAAVVTAGIWRLATFGKESAVRVSVDPVGRSASALVRF